MVAVKRSQLLKLQAGINHYNPRHLLKYHDSRCRHLGEQLDAGMARRLKALKERLENTAHNLHTVSPLVTLERGYAIVTRVEDNRIIRDAASLRPGDAIKTRLARGQIHSTVEKVSVAD